MTEGREVEPGEGAAAGPDEGPENGRDEGAAAESGEGAAVPGTGAQLPEADAATLEALRERILEVDDALVRLVGERRQLVLDVGRRKAASGRPVMDPSREAKVVRRAAALAREEGIDEEMVRDVIWRIIASARDEQEGRTRWGPPSELDPRPDSGADDEGSPSDEGGRGSERG